MTSLKTCIYIYIYICKSEVSTTYTIINNALYIPKFYFFVCYFEIVYVKNDSELYFEKVFIIRYMICIDNIVIK